MEVLYHGEKIELEEDLEMGEQELDILSYPNEDTVEFSEKDILHVQEIGKENEEGDAFHE